LIRIFHHIVDEVHQWGNVPLREVLWVDLHD
jgi:hypothetical protein